MPFRTPDHSADHARARYEALGAPRAVAGRAAEALGRLLGSTLPP